jgi:hypothetical protein
MITFVLVYVVLKITFWHNYIYQLPNIGANLKKKLKNKNQMDTILFCVKFHQNEKNEK